VTLRDRPDLDHQEQNRLKIADKAEAAGWAVTGNNPLVLNKGEKQIIITFNSGGMPNGAQWINGDEFPAMGASGYMDLNIIFNDWLTWEEKSDQAQEKQD
jgi:hypothetical protein